jgi:hypothetical protein
MQHSAAACARVAVVGALLATVALAAGCASQHPPPLDARDLERAQDFPYFKTYWVGRVFERVPVTAADGREGYDRNFGESVYYGDCDSSGFLGSGSCVLPLQVTTAIYSPHLNTQLGPQRNTIIRGVPATIFDGGRSIELYSGRVAIDVFADSAARARRAAEALQPMNANGSASTRLPLPTYHPGLVGPAPAAVSTLIDNGVGPYPHAKPLLGS